MINFIAIVVSFIDMIMAFFINLLLKFFKTSEGWIILIFTI